MDNKGMELATPGSANGELVQQEEQSTPVVGPTLDDVPSLALVVQQGQSAVSATAIQSDGLGIEASRVVDTLLNNSELPSLDAEESSPKEQFSSVDDKLYLQNSNSINCSYKQSLKSNILNNGTTPMGSADQDTSPMDLDFQQSNSVVSGSGKEQDPVEKPEKSLFFKNLPDTDTKTVFLSKTVGFTSQPSYAESLRIPVNAQEPSTLLETPLVVQNSIPLSGSSPDCGITVERLKNTIIDNYVDAVEHITGKKSVIYIGQSPEDPKYIIVFLASPAFVKKIVSQGIRVRGSWLCVTYFQQPATKVVVSGVMPFILDQQIIDACRAYGDPVYPQLRRIPAGVRAPHLMGVLSFRRELLIVLKKDAILPDEVAVFVNGIINRLSLSTEGVVCFRCSKKGHLANNCKTVLPKEQTQQQRSSTKKFDHSINLPLQGGVESQDYNRLPSDNNNATKFCFNNNIIGLRQENRSNMTHMQAGDKTSSENEWRVAGRNKKNILLPDSLTVNVSTSSGKVNFKDRPISAAPTPTSLLFNKMVDKSGDTSAFLPTAKSCRSELQSDVLIHKGQSNHQISGSQENRERSHRVVRAANLSELPDEILNSGHSEEGDDDDDNDNEGSEELTDQKLIVLPGGSKRKKKHKKRSTLAKVMKVEEKKKSNNPAKSDIAPRIISNPSSVFNKDGDKGSKERNVSLTVSINKSSSRDKLDSNTCLEVADDLISKLTNLRAAKRTKLIQEFLEVHPSLLQIISTAQSARKDYKPGDAIYKNFNRIKDEIKILRSSSVKKKRNKKSNKLLVVECLNCHSSSLFFITMAQFRFDLSIATFNTAGLAKDDKRLLVDNLLFDKHISICAFQETNFTSVPSTWRHGSIYGFPSKSPHAGLAIWINCDINVQVIGMEEIVVDHVISFDLVINGFYITLYNIHLPHKDSDVVDVLNKWIESLQNKGLPIPNVRKSADPQLALDLYQIVTPQSQSVQLNDGNNSHCYFILGDFNLFLDKPEGNSGQWKKLAPRKLLNDIFIALGVEHVPMAMEQNGVLWTRNTSVIDYICLPRSWRLRIKTFCVSKTDVSDHSLVTVTLKYGKDAFIKPPYWRFRNELLNDQGFVDEITSFLVKKAKDIPENQAIHPWWDNLKKEFISIANKRWNDINKSMVDGNHISGRNQSKKNCRNGRSFPSPIQKIHFLLDGDHNLISGKERILDSIAEYYEVLYSPGSFQQVPQSMTFGLKALEEEDMYILSEPITINELESAVNSLNLGKAPGIDGITVECYVKFWTLFAPIIFAWVKQTLLLGKLCGSASLGVVTLIFKDGDPRNIKNWRPITLMTVDLKILSRALAVRLKTVILRLIPDFQNCLPGRSIHRSLALVRDVLACAKIHHQPVCILTLDQTKAFDRINHEFLFRLLEIVKLPSYMIQAIKTIYSGYSVCFKNIDTLSRPVKYSRGIRQGDPLSTILYALAFLPALNMVKETLPYEGFLLSNGSRILLTSYADDVTFFLSSVNSVQVIVHALSIVATFSEAAINLNKSVVAPFFYSQVEVNQFRTQVQDFVFSPERIVVLGVTFTPKLNIDQDQWNARLQRSRDMIVKQNSRLIAFSYYERAAWISLRIWPRWVYLLKVLHPSDEQIHQLKALFSEVIWLGGKHWMSFEELVLPKHKGGLSLISPGDRISVMRVMFLSKVMLEGTESQLFLLSETILRHYAQANLGFTILHSVPEQHPIMELPRFYRAALHAWHQFPIASQVSSLNVLMSMPCFSSRFLMQQEPPVEITTGQAKDYGAVTIRQLLTAHHRTTRKFWATQQAVILAVSEWAKYVLDQDVIDIDMPNKESDLPLIRAPSFVLKVNERVYSMQEWTGKRLISVIQDDKVIGVDYGVPFQTWKILATEQISSTVKNQYWRFLHHRVPTPSLYKNMGVRVNASCILCGELENDFDHQFRTCPTLTESINALTLDVEFLALDPLDDQRQLYSGGTHGTRLANICIMTFIYMVIVVTRSVANSRFSVTKLKVKDIYYDLLAKHVIMFARSFPPSNLDKRFKWLVLTHGDLLARIDGNNLSVRTSVGYRPYLESSFNVIR